MSIDSILDPTKSEKCPNTTLPNGWRILRLKSLLLSPLKYGANESAELDDRSLPRFIRITDIGDDGQLREETFRSLPLEIAKEYLLQDGDLLFARSGATVGKSVVYSESWGPACFAGYLIRARLNKTLCLPKWLNYFCQTSLYWDYITGTQIQATIQNVSADKYGNLRLPVPTPPEQRAIAAFLDAETSKIDALVAEQRRLIELLKEKRQAVISHAVTKGLNPHVKMKPSGIDWLGDVPAHWEILKGGYLGKIFGSEPVPEDLVCDEGRIPFIKVGSLSSDSFEIKSWDWFVSESVDERYRTQCDFVVFPKRGAAIFLNKVNVVDRPSVIDPNLMGWIIRSNVDKHYVAYLLKVRKLEKIADTSTVPQINNKHILPEKFPAPPLEEQRQIVCDLNEQTKQIDVLLEQVEQSIVLLQERRTALISAAVTGKIDVRDFIPKDVSV